MQFWWLFLLIFPAVWPFAGKYIWDKDLNWQEVGLNVVIACALTVAVLFAGWKHAMHDVEILNGMVIGKDQEVVPCSHSYACNCKTDSQGNSSCDICFEHTNDWDWVVKTNVGETVVDRIDRRGTFEPPRFTQVVIGETASLERPFDNYVKAVPESLFNTVKNDSFDKYIPSYPKVYDYYRMNRVIDVNSGVIGSVKKDINIKLNESLKLLGNQKEVNIIVILTNIKDSSFKTAVENKWIGGKKNDVVIFVGLEGNDIGWVDVMTWARNAGNELFDIKLRDAIKEMKVFDSDVFVSTVINKVKTDFVRPKMKSYEYLKDGIEPPTWSIWLAFAVSIISSLLLTLYFREKDVKLF